MLRRRTIKESLDKSLSIEMIEYLELSLIFFAVGNMTFNYHLFGKMDWQEITILVIAVIYSILPMQEINEKLFPLEEQDEEVTYDIANGEFDTDYDRENPVYKKHAMNSFQQMLTMKSVGKAGNASTSNTGLSKPYYWYIKSEWSV